MAASQSKFDARQWLTTATLPSGELDKYKSDAYTPTWAASSCIAHQSPIDTPQFWLLAMEGCLAIGSLTVEHFISALSHQLHAVTGEDPICIVSILQDAYRFSSCCHNAQMFCDHLSISRSPANTEWLKMLQPIHVSSLSGLLLSISEFETAENPRASHNASGCKLILHFLHCVSLPSWVTQAVWRRSARQGKGIEITFEHFWLYRINCILLSHTMPEQKMSDDLQETVDALQDQVEEMLFRLHIMNCMGAEIDAHSGPCRDMRCTGICPNAEFLLLETMINLFPTNHLDAEESENPDEPAQHRLLQCQQLECLVQALRLQADRAKLQLCQMSDRPEKPVKLIRSILEYMAEIRSAK